LGLNQSSTKGGHRNFGPDKQIQMWVTETSLFYHTSLRVKGESSTIMVYLASIYIDMEDS
jgi:hypothetical protein